MRLAASVFFSEGATMNVRTFLLSAIVGSSFAVPCVLGAVDAPSEAESLTEDERFLQIESLCLRKSDVFAVHKLGMYRAARTTNRWRRLSLPREMPLDGGFANAPEDVPVVIYTAAKSRVSRLFKRDDKNTGRGVYISEDAGDTWRRVIGTEDATAACWHRGKLYVGVCRGLNGVETSLLRVSGDLGVTWRDISLGDVGKHTSVSSIIPDPDHETLVSVQVDMSIRAIWLQAEDDGYEWKWHHGIMWEGETTKHDIFRVDRYHSSTIGYFFPATLENYFRYSFGETPGRCPFRLVADQKKFVFRAGEPVLVPFTLRFEQDLRVVQAWWRAHPEFKERGPYPTTPNSTNIPDDEAGSVWGLNVEFAGKQTMVIPPLTTAYRAERDQNSYSRKLRDDPAYKTYPLSAEKHYHRTLDLAKRYDFSRPGSYRVQLTFDSSPLGNITRDKNGRFGGVWGGGFNGEEFEITIQEEPVK